MTTIDDLFRLSPSDMQTLARHVLPNQWALAFAGMSDTLRNRILDSFTTEFARRVWSQAVHLGYPPRHQVECIQDDIVDTLADLIAQGYISLVSSDRVPISGG